MNCNKRCLCEWTSVSAKNFIQWHYLNSLQELHCNYVPATNKTETGTIIYPLPVLIISIPSNAFLNIPISVTKTFWTLSKFRIENGNRISDSLAENGTSINWNFWKTAILTELMCICHIICHDWCTYYDISVQWMNMFSKTDTTHGHVFEDRS